MIGAYVFLLLCTFAYGLCSGYAKGPARKRVQRTFEDNISPLSEENEYRWIRDNQVALNKSRAIRKYISDHSLGIDFSSAGKGLEQIFVKDEDGCRTLYKVFYKQFTGVEGGEVFALRKVDENTSPRVPGKVHKTAPLLRCAALFSKPPSRDYNIYTLNKGKNVDTAERLKKERIKRRKSMDLDGFYSDILQKKTDELQRLAYEIADSGNPAVVCGADYNDNCQPTKKELRALASGFEAMGFVVGPINFSLGELTLSLEGTN